MILIIPLLFFVAKDFFSPLQLLLLLGKEIHFIAHTQKGLKQITSEFGDACFALVITEACYWCSYQEVYTRKNLNGSMYFNIFPRGGWGKGILVYSAAVLVTRFRDLSLTCSLII